MPDIPADIQERLKPLLKQIAVLFKAPLITIVVRSGDNAAGDLVLSNDNPSLAIEALRRQMVAEVVKNVQELI